MALVMTPIYTQTVGSGGANTVTFNNIPQVYTDLQIQISARSSWASGDSFFMQAGTVSGLDSSNNYSQTRLGGDGGGVWSDRQTGQNIAFVFATIPTAAGTANTFGNAEIYIPNYAGSSFKSMILNLVSERNAATGVNIEQDLHADLWRNTGALTTLRFATLNGANFVQHSTFSLYGIIRSGA